MKNEVTPQVCKIQITQKIDLDIELPAYFKRVHPDGTGINYSNWFVMIKDPKMALHTTDNSISEYTYGDLGINNDFTQCTESEFYQALADNIAAIAQKNIALAQKYGLQLMPLHHELTDEDCQQLRYDEGRELINEDRRERDNDRKDEISHDPNY